MESLENCPAYYHLMLDLNWESGPVDLAAWLEAYCERRYGGPGTRIRTVNTNLMATAYAKGGRGYSSVIAARPAVFPLKSSPARGFDITGKALASHVAAWEALLADRELFAASPGYRYDVVDLGRQVLSYLAVYYQRDTAIHLHRRDRARFNRAAARFLALGADLDALTGTDQHFLFGKWLADARSWGTDAAESEYFARSAARLVTLWGWDNPDSKAPNWQDYAWREWNGLIGQYYLPRWQQFFAGLDVRLARGEVFADVLRDKWGRPLTAADTSGLYQRLYGFESSFPDRLAPLPHGTTGDAIAIAVQLLDRYRDDLAKAASRDPLVEAMFEAATIPEVPGVGVDVKTIRMKPQVLERVLGDGPHFSE
jgi:alpha-N-acetylglucosaminidase